MIRALLWKEWHEQKYRCLMATLVMLMFVGGARWLVSRPDDATGLGVAGLVVGTFLIPLYLAMGVFATERTGRTMGVLAALPVSSWRITAAKLLMASLAVIIPFTVCSLLWIASKRTSAVAAPEHQKVELLFIVVQAVFILIWTATLAAGRRTEIWVVFTGVLCLLVTWGLIEVLISFGASPRLLQTVALLSPLAPTSWISRNTLEVSAWRASFCCTATFSVLLTWCNWRWRREPMHWWAGRERVLRNGTGEQRAFRTQAGAIAWRERSELAMFVFAACAIIMCFPLLPLGAALLSPVPFRFEQLEVVPMMLTVCMIIMGGPMAVLVAAYITSADLSPKLHEFWRTRPIRASQWFAARFLSGALAWCGPLVIVVGASLLFDWAMRQDIVFAQFMDPNNVDPDIPRPDSHVSETMGLLLLGPPLLLAVFAWTFWLGCLIRRIVMVAMAGLAIVVIAWLSPYMSSLRWLQFEELTNTQAHLQLGWPYWRFVIIYLIAAALGTLLAWQTIRRDWSWRRLFNL